MTVRTILTVKGQEVVTISAEARVEDAVALIAQRRIGAVPVVEGGTVTGIFSERDLVRSVAKEGPIALTRSVGSVMSSPAITITSETSLNDAMSLMSSRRIRHLPVVDNGVLCGLVSIGDLVKDRIETIEQEAQVLRDYIQTA